MFLAGRKPSNYSEFMKAVKIVLSTLLCTVMLNGCTPKPRQELNVWVITDLHYLAEDLFAVDAPSFQKILESSGGKMIESMPEAMAEFQDMAVKVHPDAILIPGDITFNGEYESMTELKTIFRNLQKEGIQILLIPAIMISVIHMPAVLPEKECLEFVIFPRKNSQSRWEYSDMSSPSHMRRIRSVIPMP